MDMTIGDLKIGSPLVMGKYGVRMNEPQPILWLKGTPNCDFISQCVLDYICFDARERGNEQNNSAQYSGNAKYSMSNIFSYANSDMEAWYHEIHAYDAPPNRANISMRNTEYESHYGFLYFFEDYEIESLKSVYTEVDGEQITSIIRLPSMSNFEGAERWKLFSKRGIRPKGSMDFCQTRYSFGFDDGSYIPFWISDASQFRDYASIVSRSGIQDRLSPRDCCGFRPACTLNPQIGVTLNEDGLYYINPFEVERNVCTDEELFNLLGVTRP